MKFTSKGIYAYNENGMHYYDYQAMHTHTLHLFDITNCGIVLNKDASLLAVADFGGTVQVFDSGSNGFPKPKASVTIGLPIRSLAWCR